MAASKDKPPWRKIYRTSLFSAFFIAIYKIMDNVTVHNFIKADDGFTAACAYLIFAGWIGVISSLVFTLLLGKKLIDPGFKKIDFFENKKMHLLAIICGFASAGGTLFNLWGNQFGDPSALIALGNMVVVFTVLHDLKTKKVILKQVLLPLTLVVGGGIMAAFGGSFRIVITSILLAGIISNLLYAYSEIVEQKGILAGDGANFFFWRFFWLATTGTLFTFTIAIAREQHIALIKTIIKSISYTPWFILTMFFVFLGIGLKFAAKKVSAVSAVLMVLSAQIVLGYLFTLSGDSLFPGVFGKIPVVPIVWFVRIIGSALIVGGVLHLQKSNPNR